MDLKIVSLQGCKERSWSGGVPQGLLDQIPLLNFCKT